MMHSHSHGDEPSDTPPVDAIVLRVGTPGGELIIREATKEQRNELFKVFKSIGWMVEERKFTDRAPTTGGWFGKPIRSANID